MYLRRTPGSKRDAVKRWELPDRVFFACGACHVLAYAFLECYEDAGFRAMWIKPAPGYTGNHIVAISGQCVFDYHGYSRWTQFRQHTWKRARQHWPGWDAELVALAYLLASIATRQGKRALAKEYYEAYTAAW